MVCILLEFILAFVGSYTSRRDTSQLTCHLTLYSLNSQQSTRQQWGHLLLIKRQITTKAFSDKSPHMLHNKQQFFGHFRTAALSNGFRIFHSIEHKVHYALGMDVLINESRSNHSFYVVEDPGISLNTWYQYGATFLMDTQLKLYRDGVLVSSFLHILTL